MKRPNILIIYTDQQRWDALGVNGNSDIKTPNLDKLAKSGVNFDYCFVQNQLCMPSRVSFFTGQYPSALKITHMGVPVPKETVTLPKILHNFGYHCANIGKLHFLPHANRDHRDVHPDYGFDQLEVAEEPGPYEDAYRAWVAQKRPSQLDLVSAGMPPNAKIWNDTMGVKSPVVHPLTEGEVPAGYTKHEGGTRFAFLSGTPFPGDDDVSFSAFVADQTCSYLENRDKTRPFCAVAGFYSPHAPWIVPQRFLDMYDPETLKLPEFPEEIDAKRPKSGRATDLYSDAQLRRARQGYYAAVTEVDHYCGVILDKLKELGLEDNTIIVFTSDHGEWLGEQLLFGKSYPAHDGVSRVPLIVRKPGGDVDKSRHEIVEAVDVLPTLLDAVGVQVPPYIQGRSFNALLKKGESISYASRSSALLEYTGWRSVRTHTYRYIAHSDGRELLFDLTRPNGEYSDVSGTPAKQALLESARKEMIMRVIGAENPLPKAWTY
jgi:arylsulfatase A-like enzyme